MNPPNHAEPNSAASDGSAEGEGPAESTDAVSPPAPPTRPVAPPIVKTRKPGQLKRRAIAGGFVAAVIAVAAMLQGLFNGFGLGTGDGGGPGSGNGNAKSNADKTPKTSKANSVVSSKTPVEETIPAGSVVEIRIDGDTFYRRLKDGRNGPRELSIAEIVAAAKKTEPKGVRVRVYQRFNANLSKWDELKTALLAAGLKRIELDPIDEDK